MNSYPFIALQVKKEKKKKIYVIIIIIQPLAKTTEVISSKENFQSTQLYGQVHRFIIS